MSEEESLKFRLRKIDKTRNHLLEEIKHSILMSEKYKKTLKYLTLAYFSFSSYWFCFICFISLCFVGVTSSAVGIKICAITAEIKKFKSIIKKKKKEHDKLVLLGKDK